MIPDDPLRWGLVLTLMPTLTLIMTFCGDLSVDLDISNYFVLSLTSSWWPHWPWCWFWPAWFRPWPLRPHWSCPSLTLEVILTLVPTLTFAVTLILSILDLCGHIDLGPDPCGHIDLDGNIDHGSDLDPWCCRRGWGRVGPVVYELQSGRRSDRCGERSA